MTLETIKLQTTWNDAAGSINSNFSKILQVLASINGGGTGGGGIDEAELLEFLVENGYITEDYLADFYTKGQSDAKFATITAIESLSSKIGKIEGAGYITSEALSPYLKISDADSTFATITSLGGVDERLKEIEEYFNGSGEDADNKINKWNEIVAFLNATEDTTLAGILAAYTLKSDHNALAERVIANEGAISGINTTLGSHTSTLSEHTTAINTLGSKVNPIDTWFNEVGKFFKKDSDGVWYVDGSFYTKGQNAAGAVGSPDGGGSSGSGVMLLESWSDVPSDLSGYALSAALGIDLHERFNNYYTIGDVDSRFSGINSRLATLDSGMADRYTKAESDGRYLKLSGGTITGGYLYIKNRLVEYGLMEFHHTDGDYVFLANNKHAGKEGKNLAIYNRTSWYDILHSGNANKTDVPWTASNILFPEGTSATWNVYTIGAYKGITVLNAVQAKPEGAPDHYAVGLSVSGYYGFTLASLGTGDVLLYRRKNETDWRTIAFTDSNVASATKLEDNTSFTAWGQTFFENGKPKNVSGTLSGVTNINSALYLNSFGNATIGSQDLAGVDYKLFVESGIASQYFLQLTPKENVYSTIEALETGMVLNSVHNGVRVLPIMLATNGGNVGIGTTSPAYTLDVAGYARVNAIVSNVVIDINRNPSNGAVLNSNLMGLEIEAYASRVQFKAYTTSGTYLTGITINSNDYVGIGITDPQYKLDVNGSFNATSGYINGNTLIHSENVGDYSAGGIKILSSPSSELDILTYFNTYGKGLSHFLVTSKLGDIPAYGTVLNIGSNVNRFGRLMFTNNNDLYWQSSNGNSWNDRKTIAFTDSNVDSAQTLKNSNGTVGATAQSSGLVSFASHIVPNNDSQAYVGVADKAWYAVYTNGLWSPSGKTLYLGANNSNHIIVNTSGNVAINNTLSVSSTSTFSGLLTASAGISTPHITIGGITISVVDGVLRIDGNVYTTGQLGVGAVGQEGGGTGGGGVLLLNTWPTDGGSYAGYALGGNLGIDLNTRVKNLEGKATAVSFSQTLTSGKQIGVLTIDGSSSVLYAPSTYAWSEITSRPSKLSDFTDDVVAGKYLPLSGGTISGTSVAPLIINTSASDSSVVFRINSASKTQIGYSPSLGSFIYNYSSSKNIGIKDDGTPHYNGNTLYHAGNFNPADYLPLTGGTMKKGSTRNYLFLDTDSADGAPYITFRQNGNNRVYIGHSASSGAFIQEGSGGTSILTLKDGVAKVGGNDVITSAGGTIDISAMDSFVVKRSNGYNSAIAFDGQKSKTDYTVARLGLLGFSGYQNPAYFAADGTPYTLLHSGNVGNYALKTDGSNKMSAAIRWNDGHEGNDVADWDTVATETGLRIISSATTTSHAPTTYATALHVKGRYGFQLASEDGAHDNFWIRNVRDKREWKKLAFTDSTVDKARALVYYDTNVVSVANSNLDINRSAISGELFNSANLGFEISCFPTHIALKGYSATNMVSSLILNSSGNVTIGSSDLALTTTKLYVDGGIRFAPRTIWGQSFDGTGDISGHLILNNQSAIQSYTTSGTQLDLFNISSGNNLSIGYSMAGVGGSYIYGNVICLRCGSSRTNGLILNQSGNVTIGASDLAGTDYRLRVDGRTYLEAYNGNSTYVRIGASNAFGLHIEARSNGNTYFQSQRFDATTAYYNIVLQELGGNVLIGTTTNSGYKLDVAGSIRTTSSLTIGTIVLTDENGTLKIAGNAYTTGQLGAGEAGQPTSGGGSLILDYDSIVDALGFTPAKQNDLSSLTSRVLALENAGSSSSSSSLYGDEITIGSSMGNIYISSENDVQIDSLMGSVLVNGSEVLTKANTAFTRSYASGTKIGTIKIGGTSTDIYVPTSGSHWNGTFDSDIMEDVIAANKDYVGALNIIGYDGSFMTDLYLGYDGYTTYVTGFSEASDMRLKTVIDAVNLDIRDIAFAPIFNYVFKSRPQGRQMLGSSAQYWQSIAPKAVSENDKGNLAMNYGAIALASVVAVAKTVVTHEEEIAELKLKVQSLESRLARYELN